ncbi:MAG: hypothetical protein JXQ69_02180 [Paludibacteraceae bacterium]|nr:hypothetical protein [Paludibacteraceae bacterium]MBN2787107.1 hypothetical protein [Paludibacteraceae bacterium]
MTKKSNCCPSNHSKLNGLGFATLLIVSGVLLLFTKLNFIPAKYIDAIVSWQSVVILIGLISIVKRQFLFGLSLIFVGKFFLIPEIAKVPDNFLGAIPDNFVQLYWPVLLIFAGVIFILHRFTAPSRKFETIREKFLYEAEKHGHKNEMECENGFIKKNSVFASSEHIVLEPIFKGGYIKTVFGETKIDLRKTDIENEPVRIDVDVAFSGMTIFVPSNWQVQLNVNSVFGAFEDKRSFKEKSDANKTLIIYGSIVFGGGEIRN